MAEGSSHAFKSSIDRDAALSDVSLHPTLAEFYLLWRVGATRPCIRTDSGQYREHRRRQRQARLSSIHDDEAASRPMAGGSAFFLKSPRRPPLVVFDPAKLRVHLPLTPSQMPVFPSQSRAPTPSRAHCFEACQPSRAVRRRSWRDHRQ